jgi:hypothetical protein
MRLTLLDANPIIALGGQIAAIVLCIFFLISVLLMLAINIGLAFMLSWIREKTNAIKSLRPTVDSVNRSSEAALQGREIEPTEENKVAHTMAALPAGIHAIDQKVEQVSGKVASAAIEVRARAAQAQAIVKTFLAPRTSRQKMIQPESAGRLQAASASAESSKSVEEIKAVEEQAAPTEEPVTPAADGATRSDSSKPTRPAGRRQHVSAH